MVLSSYTRLSTIILQALDEQTRQDLIARRHADDSRVIHLMRTMHTGTYFSRLFCESPRFHLGHVSTADYILTGQYIRIDNSTISRDICLSFLSLRSLFNSSFFFSFRRLFRGKSAVLENFPNTGCIVLMVSGECQKRWEIIFLFDSSLVFLSLSLSLCALFHNLSVTSEILFLLFCTLCIETTLNEVLWESRNLFLLCIKLCSLFIPQKTRKDWVCFDGTELANNDRPALLHVPR